MPLPQVECCTFNCTLDGSKWAFLVQVPEGEPTGLLINLHGHYSDEYQMMTPDIYEDAFGKLRRACLRQRWVMVTAWYGGNTWMGPVAEAGMVDLLAALRERWPGVPFYLQGGSMGGASALIFAFRQPQLLAGVSVFCPAGDIEGFYEWALGRAPKNPTLKNVTDAIRLHYTVEGRDLEEELQARSAVRHAERFTMPVYISHGAKDALVPVRFTRQLVTRLQELGKCVRYEELADGDHDAPVMRVNWKRAFGFLAGV